MPPPLGKGWQQESEACAEALANPRGSWGLLPGAQTQEMAGSWGVVGAGFLPVWAGSGSGGLPGGSTWGVGVV